MTAAAEKLGLPVDASTRAETSRLVTLGPGIRFRHQLVRSAVYHAATLSDRQRCHRELAAVTQLVGDLDRSTWHRAQPQRPGMTKLQRTWRTQQTEPAVEAAIPRRLHSCCAPPSYQKQQTVNATGH